MVRFSFRNLQTRLSGELGLRSIGKARYAVLLLVCLAQLSTVMITWPTWQVRDDPRAMPATDWSLPELPFGIFMVVSILAIAAVPRPSIVIHGLVLVVACWFDQFRLQPQFFWHLLLMLSLTCDIASRIGRWSCATLWFWAGLHKAFSAEWWQVISSNLLGRVSSDLSEYDTLFAGSIVLGEVALGALAMIRPRWGLYLIIPLHLGITFFLLTIQWNYSVIPWNLSMALGGTWLIWEASRRESVARWEYGVLAAALAFPIGFYTSHVDHGFAHVLYSGQLPQGIICRPNENTTINAWGEMAVAFPKERRLHRRYFEVHGNPGDKLHISDPRWLLPDLYYVLSEESKAIEISAREFYANKNGVEGVGIERRIDVLALLNGGAELLRKREGEPIYAIRFDPDSFRSELLFHLRGIPNVEQIQLEGTSVQDQDLAHLSQLYQLRGVGLSNTNISDRGLEHLRKLPHLERIDCSQTEITSERLQQLGLYSTD